MEVSGDKAGEVRQALLTPISSLLSFFYCPEFVFLLLESWVYDYMSDIVIVNSLIT